MDPQAAAAGPLRQERVCPDCKGFDFVEDHARGDIVCKVGFCNSFLLHGPLCMAIRHTICNEGDKALCLLLLMLVRDVAWLQRHTSSMNDQNGELSVTRWAGTKHSACQQGLFEIRGVAIGCKH